MTSSRKATIREAFNAAAPAYTQSSGLQQSVAEELADRLALAALPSSSRVLEVGCGTGYVTRRLVHDCPPDTEITVTDLSPAMLQSCRAALSPRNGLTFMEMDGEAPSVSGAFDLICSNLAVQWFDDPVSGVARLAALLRPGGVFGLATFVAGTFSEWDDALRREGLSVPTLPFVAPDRLEQALGPFGDVVVDIQDRSVVYPDAKAFLNRIKAIGAATPAPDHRPLSGGALRRAMRGLEADAGPDGIAVTYRVFSAILTRN